MTGKRLTWLLAVLLAIPLLVLTAVGLVAGTDAGTAWLLRTAQPYLPPALHIGEARGSLLSGMSFQRIAWTTDALTVEARDVAVNAELFPLLDRQIRILDLDVDALDILPGDSEKAQSDGGLPEIDLPVGIYLADARIENIRIGREATIAAIDALALAGSLAGSRLFIDRLDLDSERLDLELSGRSGLAGRYPVNATADWRLRLADGTELSGRLGVDGNIEGYRLGHRLSTPLRLSTAGTLSAADGSPVADLETRWDDIEWSIAGRRLRSRDGVLATRGWTDDVELSLKARASVDDYPEAGVALEGNTDLQSLSIVSLEVDGPPGRLRAAGSIGWDGTPEFDLRVTGSGLDPGLVVADLDGRLDVVAQTAGRLPVEGIEATVDIDSLTGMLQGQSVSAGGEVRVGAGGLDFSEIAVSFGDNRVALSGRLGDELNLDADIDFDELPELDGLVGLEDALRGSLEADVRLRGTREAPDVTATFEAVDAAFRDYAAQTLTGSVTGSPFGAAEIRVEATGVEAVGRRIPTASAEVGGTRERHRFSLTAEQPDGRIALSGKGSLADNAWGAELDELTADTSLLSDWMLVQPAGIALGDGLTEISDLCLASTSGDGRVCIDLRFPAGEAGEFDVEVDRLPFGVLPIRLPETARTSGFIQASAEGRFADGRIDAGGRIEIVDGTVETTYAEEAVIIDITRAMSTISVDANRLTADLDVSLDDGDARVRAEGAVENLLEPHSPLEGDVTLEVDDVGVLSAFIAEISNPRGSAGGSVGLTGTLGQPRFSGEIRLRDGAFGVRATGIEVEDVGLTLRQADTGRLLLEGSARSGQGQIRLEGATEPGAAGDLRAVVRLTGEDTAVVTGSLAVPEAGITLESLPQTATRPSTDVTVHGDRPRTTERGRRVSVDVNVSLAEAVRFSGFGLTTNVAGAVRLRGSSDEPFRGDGSLSLIEGRYKAYGQNLQIESGELLFNGPLDNPTLDVRAVRNIEAADVVAGIRLTGTPRRLTSEVFSEPSLSDAEALSYLLTGRALSDPGSSEDADLVNQAAFALGLSQAGSIASQIRGDLGLDTLAVEGGTSAGRIVAGKRFGDRLLVEYGYGIIDQLGTLLLRYQLTDNVIVETRTGTVSELDVVYSVKKK